MTQVCNKCGIQKELKDFYKHPDMRNGCLGTCKECKKKYTRDKSRSKEGREYDRKRRETPKRKKWLAEYQRKRRQKFQDRYKARNAVSNAIRNGTLQRKYECEICNSPNEIEAHHDDYSKKLQVLWLCRKCHRERHNQFMRKD